MGEIVSKKYPRSIQFFLSHVKHIAKIHGVKLLLVDNRSVSARGKLSNGLFMESPPTLVVAMKQPIDKWLPVLLHEYSHMTQWIDELPLFTDRYIDGFGINSLITLWINHRIELSKEQLNDYIQRIQNLELDCEKRTVNNIKLFGLPIKIDEYIQKANSYIFFYKIVRHSRCWYKIGKEPYNLRKVWRWMPKDFNNNDGRPDMVQYEVLLDLTE